MNRRRLGAVGVLTVGGAVAYLAGRSVLASRSAEAVEYTLERTLGDHTEIRRYPELVRVETTAPSNRAAFGRLFEYIDGANESRSDVAMTTPVRTESESISMTTPVRTDEDESGVGMAFYLPRKYTPNTAPRPTDPNIALAVEPPRSLAVRTFSWWATDRRTERQRRALVETLADSDVETIDEPFSLSYDPPGTPPFWRTNEVAVEVTW